MHFSFYSTDSSQDKEHVPETDPQDGFAVLNAALTLNSLLAKAKAQQSEAQAIQRATLPMMSKVCRWNSIFLQINTLNSFIDENEV